jgi:predicted nucleic acid-binding protein
VIPFDESAAMVYGPLRARLEAEGRRLDEPDMRIADFVRVPGLSVENWLA